MTAARKHVYGARDATPQSIAERMLNEADGDLRSAAEKMFNYVSGLPRLRDEVLRAGCRKFLNECVGSERAQQRREYSGSMAKPFRMNAATLRAQERARSVGRHHNSALLNMVYIIDGKRKRLRDCTGDEMVAYGEVELLKGASAVRNARFAIAIGRLAGERIIGDAVTDDEAARLQAEAQESPV